MEMLYEGQQVDVLEQRQLSSTVLFLNGEQKNVDNKKLKPIKQVRVPLWQKQVDTRVSDLPSTDTELLNAAIASVSYVRVYCDEEHEDDAKQLFDREGIIYPENWRGTEGGKYGGFTRQRSLSANIRIPRSVLSDGLVFALEATHNAKVHDGTVEFMAGNPKASCVLKGYDDPEDYRELSRLVFYDDVPKNSESQFIGWCIRWMKKYTGVRALISFSDPKYGHKGIVYRASNWLYTGLQKQDRPRLIIDGKEMHPRAALHAFGTSSTPALRGKGLNVVLVEREPKHRYIYVLQTELTPLLKYALKPWKTA
jgi:hypothetical protein